MSSAVSYPERLRGLSIPLARGSEYLPGRWSVLLETRVIGQGREAFVAARDRILSWQMHRDAGVRVVAVDGTPPPDALPALQVRLSIGVGPIMIPAPCEVVTVIDDEHEAGFAYGTLSGHPEQGEEAFLVTLTNEDVVVGSVAAFSRPVPWAAVGAPVMQRAQRIIARRYVNAMAGRRP